MPFGICFNELNSNFENSTFMGNFIANKQINNVNIDEVVINGFYTVNNVSNGTPPFSSHNIFGLLVSGNNSVSPSDHIYTTQIVIRFSDTSMKIRSCQAGNWNPWKTIVDN